MACFHPLNRVLYKDYGWRVLGAATQENETAVKELQKFYGPIQDRQKIPCGQCIGCRMDYARDWATRCELEMRKYEHNYFVTLTYDDEHLHVTNGINLDTGELIISNTLEPKDLTTFMKVLRTKWQRNYGEEGIRFYACGEYGDAGGRAHYHIMLFNCNIRDLVKHHQNKKGNWIYTSEMLEKAWGKGIVGITEASWDTAAYTARYMLKKQKGLNKELHYTMHAQIPEFSRMSRMPGIAAEWYHENRDKLWQTDEIILAKGRKVHTPKYYDELFDKEIKQLAQKAENGDQ